MTRWEQDWTRNFVINLRAAAAACLLALLVLTVMATPVAQAQTLAVLHNFADLSDGYGPIAGLVMDRAGNFYGTSSAGGSGFAGAAFKLSHGGSGWLFTPLHEFTTAEGSRPLGLTIGPDGNLYGTAAAGGEGGPCQGGLGCGSVFKLTPPPTACKSFLCYWSATVLYRFTGGSDGGIPYGGVVFDPAGNLYGTTYLGGTVNASCQQGCGVVYKLTPSQGWKQSVLYSFGGGSDGYAPYSAVTLDSAGNLYGTTFYGGGQGCSTGCGTAYKLTPTGQGWTKTILYDFPNDAGGTRPIGGLIFDRSGNLYGTTSNGGYLNCGYYGCGTVFSLSPSSGGWTHTVLYVFTGSYADEVPQATLFMDPAGNLYGTTSGSGTTQAYGNVFELTPSNGSWIYTSLHSFTGGADGGESASSVVMDASGNLYGTASTGGSSSTCPGGSKYCGVVWEITP